MTNPWNKDIDRLIDLPADSAGTPQLNAALRKFLRAWNSEPQSDAELDDAVVAIAGTLNWDVDEARGAYARFKEIASDESKNEFKDSFIGSREQLLFGDVISNELELHPIFAALLSPTGGMVGPGGVSFHVKGGLLGYHGVAHDAGGYLCRRHQILPGYEYIVDRGDLPCEQSPLAGQVSGIAYWFRRLNLGWLNFLATSDPAAAMTPRAPSPGAGAPPLPPAGSPDGVILNEAEMRFLQSIITQEADPDERDSIEEGMRSLLERGLLSGSEEEGFEVNDQLVMAAAVYMEPETMMEARPRSGPAAGRTLRYYKWGEFVVEQTDAAPGQIRLAGLRDSAHAAERLERVMPLPPTDLDAIEISLSEEDMESAVTPSEPGEEAFPRSLPVLDPAMARGAPPNAAEDMAGAVTTGENLGTIRVHRYKQRALTGTREMELMQGERATWIVSRGSGRSGEVEVTLGSPEIISRALGESGVEE